jgi:hypothetical protein
MQAWFTGEFLPEMLHQRIVHLDGDHAPGALQQFPGERALAGADFNNQVLVRRTDSRGDAIENGALGEKMLTQLLRQAFAADSLPHPSANFARRAGDAERRPGWIPRWAGRNTSPA